MKRIMQEVLNEIGKKQARELKNLTIPATPMGKEYQKYQINDVLFQNNFNIKPIKIKVLDVWNNNGYINYLCLNLENIKHQFISKQEFLYK